MRTLKTGYKIIEDEGEQTRFLRDLDIQTSKMPFRVTIEIRETLFIISNITGHILRTIKNDFYDKNFENLFEWEKR